MTPCLANATIVNVGSIAFAPNHIVVVIPKIVNGSLQVTVIDSGTEGNARVDVYNDLEWDSSKPENEQVDTDPGAQMIIGGLINLQRRLAGALMNDGTRAHARIWIVEEMP